MPTDETPNDVRTLRAHLRLARQHAHRTDAERAETEAQLHTEKAARLHAEARTARVHAEAVTAQATVSEVRRLCETTISASIRVGAVQQATDTLALIDSIASPDPLPGDAAWHSVWLHGNWRYLTKNMTTTEREHAADAVQRYDNYLAAIDEDADRGGIDGLRWWRD
jgi:hypothetical protein